MKTTRSKKATSPRISVGPPAKRATVYIATDHTIKDPRAFWKKFVEVRKRLPLEIRLCKRLADSNGSAITFIWEAPSLQFFKQVQAKNFVGQLAVPLTGARAVFDPFPPPVITMVNPFSVMKPGGGVMLAGDNFRDVPGELRLYSANFPGGFLNLQDLKWGNQFAAGVIPNIAGVPDDPQASLVIVTKNGKQSGPYNAPFTANRDVVLLSSESPDVSIVRISQDATLNFSFAGPLTIHVTHASGSGSQDDTDIFFVRLKNGWVYDHYEWEMQDGVNGGPFGQDPDPVGASEFFVRVHWFCDVFGSADYALGIYATGPEGVPYE